MTKAILLSFFLMVSSLANSQIFIENFEYPNNTPLSDAPQWYPVGNLGINPILVTLPGLTFPGYIGSGVGNTGYITTAFGETDSASLTPSVNSGVVYASFMINLLTVGSISDKVFFTLQGSNNQNFASVAVRSFGPGFELGVQKAGGDAFVYYNQNLAQFRTYLVVAKYEFKTGSGTDDEVSLFVFDNTNPLPSIEPAPNVGPLTSASPDATDLSRVYLDKSVNSADLFIDGIYVDQSWNNTVLPVELTSFTSSVSGRDVTLNWTTTSETNNAGFEIERSSQNGVWSSVGNVTGSGTTSTSQSYAFTDRSLNTGNFRYRLKQTDYNGNFEYFNLSNEVVIGVPEKFELSQNYPNPFNPSTKIGYQLPNDGVVKLSVYDNSGKEVMTLLNEFKSAGYYSVDLNASSLSSGLYYYRLTSGANSSVKKMLLVK